MCRTVIRSLVLLFALAPVIACRSAGSRDVAVPPEAAPLPASALAGAVRALETLRMVRPAETATSVRALECSTLVDHEARREFVRVFLDLTVYAPTIERAVAAFEEIRAALETEGRATDRPAHADEMSVLRALVELDWDPPGSEKLVSYSDRVRVEITPGLRASRPVEARFAGHDPSVSLETYVNEHAARRFSVGPVHVSASRSPGADGGVAEWKLCIEPDRADPSYERAEIATFLGGIEEESPAVRVTELVIERSQVQPDLTAEKSWTFEVGLTARVLPRAAAGT